MSHPPDWIQSGSGTDASDAPCASECCGHAWLTQHCEPNVSAMSASPPRATEERTSLDVRFGPQWQSRFGRSTLAAELSLTSLVTRVRFLEQATPPLIVQVVLFEGE